MFSFECYFITLLLLFSSRLPFSCLAQILPIENLGEVSTLQPNLTSLEENLFLNFTKHLRCGVCSFPCTIASAIPYKAHASAVRWGAK